MIHMEKQQKKILKTIQYIPLISQYTFYHTFNTWHQFLKKSEKWDEKQIQNYQNHQLKSLINHAYHNVPYYQKLFQSKNLKPRDIIQLSDLEKIPVLTKDIIRKNISSLKAKNYPENSFYKRNTGGTTGTPLSFYVEKAKWLGIHFAFNKIYMQKAGYHWHDKVISISGIKNLKRHHPLYRTLELSSFNTTSIDFEKYNQHIHRFKPRFITAFPSALLLFTKDMINQKMDMYKGIQAIFCHGEILHPMQKKYLEETYNCKVFDQYGHREQCVFATTCKQSDLYHIYPEYGIVEILNEQNQPLDSYKNTGEIVATSLLNSVFPFIRYKTNDLAEISNETCNCGSRYPLLKKIIGRTQEFLIGKNHEKIPLTGLYHLLTEQSFHIKESQILQEKEGELIISYVKSEHFNEKDKGKIQQVFSDTIGKQFNLIFQSVDSIKRTKDGKYQYLIQKLRKNLF